MSDESLPPKKPIDPDLIVGVLAGLCGFQHIGNAAMASFAARHAAEVAAKKTGKEPPKNLQPFVLSEAFKVTAALDGITVETREDDDRTEE